MVKILQGSNLNFGKTITQVELEYWKDCLTEDVKAGNFKWNEVVPALRELVRESTYPIKYAQLFSKLREKRFRKWA